MSEKWSAGYKRTQEIEKMEKTKFKYFEDKKNLFFYLIFYTLLQFYFLFDKLVFWDEAVFIGKGKYLFSFGKVGLFEEIRPPLLSFFLGLIWKMNLDPIYFGRVFILLFSLGNLFLFYLICRRYFDKTLSLLSVVLLSLTPVYFIYSTKILTGIIACFFILLAFNSYQKNKLLLTSFFLGLATLTRFPSGIFFILFMLFILFSKTKNIGNISNIEKIILLTKLNVIYLLSLMPYFIINLIEGNGFTKPFLHAISHQSNYNFTLPLQIYVLDFLSQSLLFLFMIPGAYYCIKHKKHDLLFLSLVPFIYFIVIANRQMRFFNLFLPFIVLLSVFGLVNLLKIKKIYIYLIFIIFILTSGFGWYTYHVELSLNDVDEIFYFKNQEYSTILTSNPVFSAYTDNRFIPYYFDINVALKTYDEYNSNKDFNYIIYSDEFPCEYSKNNLECSNYKEELESKIENRILIKKSHEFSIYK